jgi:hypothetical protein
VHPLRLEKADHATNQAFDSGSKVDMLALDFLRIVFANSMLLGIKMPLVSASSIDVIASDAKGLKQLFQLQKNSHSPGLRGRRMDIICWVSLSS